LAAVEDGFYYNMWTEVYVGEWVALDPTFDESRVDAAHIKAGRNKKPKKMNWVIMLYNCLKL